jgi:hypothetical protein
LADPGIGAADRVIGAAGGIAAGGIAASGISDMVDPDASTAGSTFKLVGEAELGAPDGAIAKFGAADGAIAKFGAADGAIGRFGAADGATLEIGMPRRSGRSALEYTPLDCNAASMSLEIKP